MSGIGGVSSSPTPVTPDDDHHTTTAPASPSTTTTTTAPASPTTTTTAARRPAPPAAPANASDIVPANILSKYGLDPHKPATESKYTGDKWSVGYYPYDGDIQYVAFGKYKDVFKNPAAGADMHGYWEAYSNPPTGLDPGSWIGSGSIDESDFERATGIDVTGDRPIDNAAYKLMREAGAPADAKFALRDASGKQLSLKAGDKLVPTILEAGTPATGQKVTEVEVRGEYGQYYKKGTNDQISADVVWRVKHSDGGIAATRGSPAGKITDLAEDRYELAGAKDGVKFDFLDETGEPIQYNPPSDKIVPTFKDARAWHAFVPQKDAQGRVTGYEHQTLNADGSRVTARATIDKAHFDSMTHGKDVIYRVQERSGALKADGKVENSFDMGWWGKCHNVASIGASNIKMPQNDVKLVTNLAAGDTVGLEWKDGDNHNVLTAKRDNGGVVTGYTLKTTTRPPNPPTSRDVTLDEGNRLAKEKKAAPVVVQRNGTLKAAEVTTFDKAEVTAMVAHMGDGAVKYEGSVGARFYGTPDQIKLKDGATKGAFITSVQLQSGKKIDIGEKSGTSDYEESDRSVLRGPGLDSKRINSGFRTLGWSAQDFEKLQASKTDKIKNVTMVFPDGRTETVAADKIASLGWENKYDVTPTEMWSMHKNVGLKGSSVIERDPGAHVWNYTIENMTTKPIKKEEIPSFLRDAAKKPGMMKGTTDDKDKYFFKTNINGTEYTYWAKFDNSGNLADYAYLDDNVPDFFWTQHVKDPVGSTWTGEAQAPGARMEDIQRVYNASVGRYGKYALAGGVLSTNDLARKPIP